MPNHNLNNSITGSLTLFTGQPSCRSEAPVSQTLVSDRRGSN